MLTVPVFVQPQDYVRNLQQAIVGGTPIMGAVAGTSKAGPFIRQSYDGIDFLGSNCSCLPPDTNAAVGNDRLAMPCRAMPQSRAPESRNFPAAPMTALAADRRAVRGKSDRQCADDEAPTAEALTAYDHEHMVAEVARVVLGVDSSRHPHVATGGPSSSQEVPAALVKHYR
jgi:hypothetical protein